MPKTFATFVIGSLALAGIFPSPASGRRTRSWLGRARQNGFPPHARGRPRRCVHDRRLHDPLRLPHLLRRVPRPRAPARVAPVDHGALSSLAVWPSWAAWSTPVVGDRLRFADWATVTAPSARPGGGSGSSTPLRFGAGDLGGGRPRRHRAGGALLLPGFLRPLRGSPGSTAARPATRSSSTSTTSTTSTPTASSGPSRPIAQGATGSTRRSSTGSSTASAPWPARRDVHLRVIDQRVVDGGRQRRRRRRREGGRHPASRPDRPACSSTRPSSSPGPLSLAVGLVLITARGAIECWFDSWALSLAVFVPMVGVVAMMFIPRAQETALKATALLTTVATAAVGVTCSSLSTTARAGRCSSRSTRPGSRPSTAATTSASTASRSRCSPCRCSSRCCASSTRGTTSPSRTTPRRSSSSSSCWRRA